MHRSRGIAVALSLALVLAQTGSVEAHLAPVDDAGGRATHYDGATLFRGLAFADGPVAGLFEATADVPAPSADAALVMDRVIGRMSSIDPAFFDSFASRIQSGDRVEIRAALEDSAALAARAALEELGPSSATSGDASGDCIFIAGAIVAIVAGVVTVVIDVTALTVVNLVVTANVAVNVDYFYSAANTDGFTPLNSDMWVNDIARTLAA